MESLLLSAAITLIITCVATVQHPTTLFKAWLLIAGVVNVWRVVLVLIVMRCLRKGHVTAGSTNWIADYFILAGNIWCVSVGIGTALFISSGDAGLGVLGSLLAMGTVGGQCARTPGTSRLASLQMSLIMVPFALGTWLSPIPIIQWSAFLVPLYLLAMISINRQLHADYVEMIVARIENSRLAFHCALTGLPNRAYFRDHATGIIAASDRAVCVLYLDLDGFKHVNDELGHPVGDALLVQVGERLERLAHPRYVAARLGGDEFAFLMPSGDEPAAEALARSIIDCLNQPFLLMEQHEARIGVSIGLALSAPGETVDTLLAKGDQALYSAKRSGRGIFCWYRDASTTAQGVIEPIVARQIRLLPNVALS